jgi:hypothetical protein
MKTLKQTTTPRLLNLIPFLSIFFLGVGSTKAQDYIPFIQEGKAWEFSQSHSPNSGPPSNAVYHCYFEGDSIINNVEYHKLLCSHTGYYDYNTDAYISNHDSNIIYSVQGLYREDTINKKIYRPKSNGLSTFYLFDECWQFSDPSTSSPTEELVLDFSVSHAFIGENVHIAEGHQFILDSIGTQDLGDGKNRKAWYYRDKITMSFFYPSLIMEGIGGLASILSPIHYCDMEGPGDGYYSTYSLLCYSEHGSTLYPNYLPGEPCGPKSFLGQHELKQTTNNIYPNPAQDQLSFAKPISGKIEIIRSDGKKMMELEGENTQQIDIRDLSSGLYFLRFVNKTSWGAYPFEKK